MILPGDSARIVQHLTKCSLDGEPLRLAAMSLLFDLPNYDWCGVYRFENNQLELDAFVGAPTDHMIIPNGVGVCGTAIAENENQIVKDVRELENYLSCSVQTRSEIVVLIRDGETVVGQIDIDGHEVGSFDHTDEALLEQIAAILAERW